jgi:hypothetical protein
MRYMWPVLADNGADKTVISLENGTVNVSLDGDTQTYTPVGASSVRFSEERYGNHNGLNGLVTAEYPKAGAITLHVEPRSRSGKRR